MIDRVTINVALDKDDSSDPIIFGILPRKRASAILKERWDLDNFTKPKDYPGFPKDDFVRKSNARTRKKAGSY